jgi:hypothetical protein
MEYRPRPYQVSYLLHEDAKRPVRGTGVMMTTGQTPDMQPHVPRLAGSTRPHQPASWRHRNAHYAAFRPRAVAAEYREIPDYRGEYGMRARLPPS